MNRATTPPLLTTRYGIAVPTTSEAAAARSLQLYGEWAEQEADLLSGLVTEGHHVVEVGGDYAAHTVWLALAVGDTGTVHVLEPRRLPFQQLCANIALNQLANVHTHQAWAGADEGCDYLDNETARPITIDDLGLQALHLLKVNIPGILPGLLDGAAATLRGERPLIYARLGGPATAEREVAAMKSHGYRVWSHTPAMFNAGNHSGAARNIFPGLLSCNAIAAHVDSGLEFEALAEL
jgi:hypothetical protein